MQHELIRNMNERIKKMLASHHVKSNLFLIIVAAVLLEMISGVQYYYSRNLLEEELEKQAGTELKLKAMISNSSRYTVESALQSHIREIRRDMASPDSMFSATQWLVRCSRRLAGGGLAFIPYYYPQKGRLFEPYSYWKGDSIETVEITNDGHDYTESSIYQWVMETNSAYWSHPYHDTIATQKDLISYCLPIHDDNEKTVAVLYMDIDTKWLGDTLNSRGMFPSSFNLLLNAEGKLVAGPRDSLVSKATLDYVINLINDSTVEKRESEKGRFWVMEFRDPDTGEKGQLFLSNIIGNKKWLLAMACYDNEVFGDLKKLRVAILLLMMAAFGVLVLIINRFARNDRRLQKAEMEKKRIDSELLVANKIQQSMLPQENGQLIMENGQLVGDVEIYGSLVPAREVGGDLYDYFIRDEKLFFCIGDVSGKGVASAMMMAVVHTKFRDFSAHENNPARIMQNINVGCCQNNKTNMFVTLFIGVLDLPTGRLRYCDAGHDAPFIMENGEWRIENCHPHLPVGVFDDFTYSVEETHIEPNSTIFLYTDGLTEAKNSQHKLFGLERVKEVLAGCLVDSSFSRLGTNVTSPNDLIETMIEAVHQFVGDAEQSDDLTMMAIRYTPQQYECILSEKLVIKNDVKEVSKLSEFIKSVLEKQNIEKSLGRQLRLAVEEAVVNVIDYAYPVGQEGEIEVRVLSDGKTMKTVIIDSGVAFDPTAKERADTTLSAEDRQIGGLGILMVREIMDSINYERINHQNVLTLVKQLRDSSTSETK